MVIVKEREFQLSLRRVLIVVGRVLIVVDQQAERMLDEIVSELTPEEVQRYFESKNIKKRK